MGNNICPSKINRIGYLDDLKGITIILVIVGHVVQSYLSPERFLYDPLFKYIYAFHMQLFMMLSGMTMKSYISTGKELGSLVYKRAKQLLIPYFAWGIANAFVRWELPILPEMVLNPGTQLWFLWDLFFISSTFASAVYVKSKLKWRLLPLLLTAFAVWVGISLVLKGECDSTRIFRLLIFYSLGYYCKTLDIRKITHGKAITVLTMIGYVVATFFWKMQPDAENIVDLAFLNRVFVSTPYRMAVSVLGCFAFLFIVQILSQYLEKTFINSLGKITLGVYASHLFLIHCFNLKLDNFGYFGPLVVMTVLLLICSGLLIKILDSNGITSVLFLGKKCGRQMR